jgi:transposase-like protein
MAIPDNSPSPPPTTSSCPFCRSGEVFTTAKFVTDESYWRCRACGQIWNPRRLVNQRPQNSSRW